jgi:hypothetical protein
MNRRAVIRAVARKMLLVLQPTPRPVVGTEAEAKIT